MLLGAAETALGADNTALAGKWTYRSFHNNPASVDGDADKVLGLIFAEAVFAFEIPTPTTLKGAIYWDGGGLDLQGTIKPGAPGEHRHRRDCRQRPPEHRHRRLGVRLAHLPPKDRELWNSQHHAQSVQEIPYNFKSLLLRCRKVPVSP